MMINNMFKDINIMTKGLNASWKRNEVISNNIANANTPNFKKMEVKFEELLKDYMNQKSIKGFKTNERHIPIGINSINNLNYQVKAMNDFSTRSDGNNVDIDIEMAELAKNDIYFRTLSTQINSKMQRIKLVINEGKG